MNTNLLFVDLFLKQNLKFVQEIPGIKKIIHDLPLNKIETKANKTLTNFDLSAQLKGILFFYLFLAIFPFVNYKNTKSNKHYYFSFKVVLNKIKSTNYLVQLSEINEDLFYSKKDIISKEFLTQKHKTVAVNVLSKGGVFEEIQYLFKKIYRNLQLTKFFFRSSFVFVNNPAILTEIDTFTGFDPILAALAKKTSFTVLNID
jgi:hypothetical protein